MCLKHYKKKPNIQVIHIVFIRGALKDLVIIFISINRTKLKKTPNLINKKLLITSLMLNLGRNNFDLYLGLCANINLFFKIN